MTPLPRLTFLIGPPGLGQYELARALADSDPNDDTTFLDAHDPLIAATRELFFDGDALPADPIFPTFTLAAWLKQFESDLCHDFGLGTLGRITLNTWTRNGTDIIFSHTIIYHLTTLDDIKAFTAAQSPEACLIIHLGELRSWSTPIRQFWLPHNSLAERLALLTRELQPPHQPAAAAV